MKKDTDRNHKTRKKVENSGKTVKNKVSGKTKRPVTEIWDFNLDDEIEAQNKSKDAADAYGGKMPENPVSLDTGTLELLEAEELVGKASLKDTVSEPVQEKHVPSQEKIREKEKSSSHPKHKKDAMGSVKHSEKRQAEKHRGSDRNDAVRKRAGKTETGRKKKKRAAWLEDFSALDVIVALTGVVVLAVAVFTIRIYTNANTVSGQVDAMAEVGEKMEAIGIAGDSVFMAVADARLAAQEAAEMDTETEFGQTGDPEQYVEKELQTQVRLGLKLTSIQKDLKIKFTNKESGKLIGNQAFEVRIDGPESMTKVDDDKDGIIYISSIKPGEYTVTVTAPSEIDGNSVSGVSGMVTVKDQIEYKKVDVTDEVKSEAEVNVAKEDTEVKMTVESALTDTVEWVESSKTPLNGEQITYEEVKKADIPEPATVAFLESVVSVQRQTAAYFAQEARADEEEYSRPTPLSMSVHGAYFSEVVSEVSSEQGSTESSELESTTPSESENPAASESESTPSSESESAVPPAEIEDITITVNPDPGRVPLGQSISLGAKVRLKNADNGETCRISWSCDGVGKLDRTEGESVTVTADTVGKSAITATASIGESSKSSVSVEVEFYEEKPADVKVESITVEPTSVSVAVNGTVTLNAKVSPESAVNRTVKWIVTEGDDLISVDQSGKVTAKTKTGTAKVKAQATDGTDILSNECSVTVTSGVSVKIEDPGSVMVGEEKQLKATIEGSYDKDSVVWESKNKEIATFTDSKSGIVKGLTVSKVRVSVSVKGTDGSSVSAEGDLSVVSADTAIVLDPASFSMKTNEKKTIKATVTTTGDKAVEWKSSDETIVKISENKDDSCVVEALKPGRTTVVATSKANSDQKASCEISVEMADGTALLKDKDGKQLYYKDGDSYKEATVADYYKYDVFYRQKDASQYLYTGWQDIDGKRYYFDKNGTPVTGSQIIQGMQYNFNSDGSLQVNGAMGIDISRHNGDIDWNAVKNAGVNFVILRCGYRGSSSGVLLEDQKFRANIQGAAAAGLKVGVYFFSQAVNEVEAVEEASLTLDLIRRYGITYPVFMDVEDANGRADRIDAGTRTKIIRAFCETIRSGGYTAGVYANKTWLSEKMNVGQLSGYKIWLAQYASTPTYGGRYDMWQYSCKGKIPGISTSVDLDMSYMSY